MRSIYDIYMGKARIETCGCITLEAWCALDEDRGLARWMARACELCWPSGKDQRIPAEVDGNGRGSTAQHG